MGGGGGGCSGGGVCSGAVGGSGVSLESTLEVWCLHTRTLGQVCTPCIGDWT